MASSVARVIEFIFAQRAILFAALAIFVLGVNAGPIAAGATTDFRKTIVFENASVQVTRLEYPPGAASPLHTHEFPGRVIYVVEGGRLEMVPGGDATRAKTVTTKTGQVIWRPTETHIVRNAGATTASVIEVEIKTLGVGG